MPMKIPVDFPFPSASARLSGNETENAPLQFLAGVCSGVLQRK
jgi:hypothetical protein